jgi:hypothetical protein
VPAGRHTVSYRYWPASTTAALVASLGTLVLLVVAGVAPLIGRRRATRGPWLLAADESSSIST